MSKTSTKNFEEKVILTAHYKHTNVGINVEKITLIPYERADVRENVKEIKLTAPYEYTYIRPNLKKITLTFSNVLTYEKNVEK